jgi:hypothetical protein
MARAVNFLKGLWLKTWRILRRLGHPSMGEECRAWRTR